MTTIPCKRPKVRLNELLGLDRFAVVCDVPGCGWHYDNVVKTDVQQQATRHRSEHRDAVPVCDVGAGLGGTHIISCVCGHQETRGTKTDALVHRDYHLSTAHGVVTCP